MIVLRNALAVASVGLVVAMGGVLWVIDNHYRSFQPLIPPPIPGASASEQGSDVVLRGFAMGRQYKSSLLNAHGDSWLAAARNFEDGTPWAAVRDRWANQDRIWRDEPFERLIQPEIDRILGPDSPDAPDHRRAATLFLRAFAAGLKDRR